jgi:Anaphase-promoting complex subunit 4 WD40 domain
MAESILSQSFSGPTVDPDHPWLGLHPFAEENYRYFFGRTAEVRDIFLRVRENPLTVLYGQSGLGKTSLLRAGLIPKLRVERFRPVRVLLDFGEKSVSLVDQVRTALAAACADPGGDVDTLIESWAPLASLWEICAHETIRPRDLADKPPVLIIDQLEEVFTLAEQQAPVAGSWAEVAELFAQIGDLVENRAPVALQKTFKQDPRLALAYDSSPTAVRVVLSLREDYLAQVEQWKSTIPSLMRNRMPLRLLTGPQAFEAVVRPGRIDGRNLVSDRVGEQIVRFVAKRTDEIPLAEIEAVPPLLSLVCERLNTARFEAKPPQEEISDELVKSQGTDILQRFYDDSFAAFPDAQRELVRGYVEDRMVTVGGHRNPVAREDAVVELARQGVPEPDDVLDALIARRLLTAERRGGIQRLEIIHDVLTPLAVRSRKDRQERRDIDQAKRKQLETEAQLARETERREEAKRKQVEAETQLIREKRLRGRLRFALVGMTVLLFLALAAFGALWLTFQQWVVEHQQAAADRERLGRARIEEGRAWIERAKLNSARGDHFAAAVMAARAVGFAGYGRDKITGPEFREEYPVLLAYAPIDEQEAHRQIDEAVSAGYCWLPLWQTPVYRQDQGPVDSVAWSPDGKTVASSSGNKTVKLWDALSGKLLSTLEGHTEGVWSVAWSPDGKTLA